MGEVFSFVDASHLVSKVNIWLERDVAIEKKMRLLNNVTLPSVAHDKQAKIRYKGKNMFWYGYKKLVCVDLQMGLINKVAVTLANVTDAQRLPRVLPKTSADYADKRYCGRSTRQLAACGGVHLAAIKKRNMKDKNVDLDNYNSKLRMPYERVFALQNRGCAMWVLLKINSVSL